MEHPGIRQNEITQTEQELSRLEAALYDCYCEAGRAILEVAEAEGRKVNALVDSIVDTRKRLDALRHDATRED